MKKTILTISFVFLGSVAYADYWDCESEVEKRGFFGGYSTHFETVSREVSADRRSNARWEATRYGYFFIPGFVGSNEYICSPGQTEEDGHSCKWRFTGSSDCTKQ